MSEKREVRKETDFWGNEKEAIYENDRKVGEVKTEERGGFFGIGGESVKVEYDTSGREVSHSKQEERGGLLGIGAEQVEVRYDSSDKEIGHSRVEERGGFFGVGGHHVRVEYDNDQNEISQTNTERRGAFLGLGGERVRVTRYSKTDANEAQREVGTTARAGNDYAASPGDVCGRPEVGANAVLGAVIAGVVTSIALMFAWENPAIQEMVTIPVPFIIYGLVLVGVFAIPRVGPLSAVAIGALIVAAVWKGFLPIQKQSMIWWEQLSLPKESIAVSVPMWCPLSFLLFFALWFLPTRGISERRTRGVYLMAATVVIYTGFFILAVYTWK